MLGTAVPKNKFLCFPYIGGSRPKTKFGAFSFMGGAEQNKFRGFTYRLRAFGEILGRVAWT
jgi:hypothetical protein